MATITIDGVDFTVYQDVSDIDAYALGAFGDSADAWRAADADAKARAGVSATRTLDRQTWQGKPTVDGQPLDFPRTELFYPDGSPVNSATVPQRVLDADCELAMALVGGSPVENDPSTTNLTRSMKAGSVAIDYFRQLTPGTRFPLTIQELIGLWLGSPTDALGSESTGTCDKSAFVQQYDLSRGF